MFPFHIILRRRLFSETDRTKSETTGSFLSDPSLQWQLAEFDREVRQYPKFGLGATRSVNGIEYRSMFGPDWLVRIDVQFVLGRRAVSQLPDIDNLWRSYQNALAFPPPDLEVPGVARGAVLHTIVVNDNQFTRYSMERMPDMMVGTEGDMLIARFQAFGPPALRIALGIGNFQRAQ